MSATVVLIGETTSVFAAPLTKQYTTYHRRSGKQGIESATTHQADIIVLDAVSLGTHGTRICKTLKTALPDTPIIHIYDAGKKQIKSIADMILHPPLTARTLINSIEHLITKKDTTRLRCGIFALDIERRILMVDGVESVLTPIQATIIEIFLRHPNEDLSREWLTKAIWDTEFTGDTRTLSVHIRHLRQVIEENASKPHHLLTVRGIGYRLHVPENKKPT